MPRFVKMEKLAIGPAGVGACLHRMRMCLPLAMVLAFASCYKQVTSPCFSRTDTEPMEIRRIFDSLSAAPVPQAVLSDFTIDGVATRAEILKGPFSSGIQVLSSTSLRCTTPCKLGFERGTYRFLVAADGFEQKRVEYFVDWLQYIPDRPGCDYFLKGATVVEIGLQRTP